MGSYTTLCVALTSSIFVIKTQVKMTLAYIDSNHRRMHNVLGEQIEVHRDLYKDEIIR